MSWNEFALIGGEFWLLTFACVALLVHVFSDKEHTPMTLVFVFVGLAGAFLINLLLAKHYLPLLSAQGSEQQVNFHLLFNKMILVDRLAIVAKSATCLLTAAVFVYARGYINERNIPQGEFYVMAMFALIGMHTMISANHFITLYLGLELLSLPLYAMVALRRDMPVTTEAAIKYFVMGALASGLLLYGISLVYGMTGALDFGGVQHAISAGSANTLLVFGLVFIITGIAFKLGAVPFHMWIPDVYQGAPAAVTLFVATAPKVAALVMVLRLLLTALPDLLIDWQQLLIILSIASMALGNFVAILQSSLKRLLAFSAIAHVGYMLLGLISGVDSGFSAALFYILIYALMTLGAFGVITLLSQDGQEFEWIDDLKGLNTRNPWLAFIMLLIVFSMAGIPPTVGFFAKLSVLQALVEANMVWLAVLALVFAVFGAYYYIRIVRVMYFDEPVNDAPVVLAKESLALASVNGLLLLALGLAPGALLAMCQLVLSTMK